MAGAGPAAAPAAATAGAAGFPGPGGGKGQWLYKSRSANSRWYKYSKEDNKKIVDAISAGKHNCDIQVRGTVYTVDFVNMKQVAFERYTQFGLYKTFVSYVWNFTIRK